MTLAELFTLKETVETRVNQYWTFWSISIFAVCGWLYTDSAQALKKEDAALIALGLMVFFVANLSVLVNATRFVLAIHDEICTQANNSHVSLAFKQKLPQGHLSTRLQLTVVLHIIIDLALISSVIVKGWTSCPAS